MTNINVTPLVAGAVSGRLTLTTATPVLTATVSAATTVYFTPYKGNQIPVTLDGSNFFFTSFSEMSQATTDTTKSPAAVAASKIYDVFVWNNAGTLRATRGPAWSSSTSRGTGAGTSQLSLVGGYYVNTVSITNGPGAGLGTYVGSIGSNGSSQIDFILGGSASGGTAAVLNVWNNYNRVMIQAQSIDTAASYTYTSVTVRQANNSAGNQVTFLSGLAEDASEAVARVSLQTTTTTGSFAVSGISPIDTTTADATSVYVYAEAVSAVALKLRGSVSHIFAPQLGSHVIARFEESDGTHASSFNTTSGDSLRFWMPM